MSLEKEKREGFRVVKKIREQGFQVLFILGALGNPKINAVLSCDEEKASVRVEGKPLVEIGNQSLVLLGKVDVSNKLVLDNPENVNKGIDKEALHNFFEEIKGSIIRLNHLGIAYACSDIEEELAFYKRIAQNAPFKIYEESSSNPGERWFFLKHEDNDWENPLFEIVLAKEATQDTPHIQIDLDTKLPFETLQEIADRHLGKGFFSWKLDIPDIGVVLGMGVIANERGVKIELGFGTDLKSTQMHREELLQNV